MYGFHIYYANAGDHAAEMAAREAHRVLGNHARWGRCPFGGYAPEWEYETEAERGEALSRLSEKARAETSLWFRPRS